MQSSGTPAPAHAYPFEARPLVEPVDPAAARAFAQHLRQSGRTRSAFGASSVIAIVVAVVAMVMFGTVALAILATLVSAFSSMGGDGIAGVLFGLLPFLIIGAIVAVVIVSFVISSRSAAQRMFRLDRFARGNGMTYVPRVAVPGLPGMIFSLGNARHATDVVRGDRP